MDYQRQIRSYDLDKCPQQGRFVFSPARFPSFFGGFANGKTFALCLRAWLHLLSYSNNRGVLARRLVKELEDTTRAMFFELVGCDEVTIKDHPFVDVWRQDKNFLRLKNGSELRFRHLSDENALAALLSLNIRFFGIDQAEEVPESAFLTLISRIGRTDVDGITGVKQPPAWGGTVGNPKGHNWIWEYWKNNADAQGWSYGKINNEEPLPKTKRFHLEEARTDEGPTTSAEYVETLKATYPPRWIKRYVYGDWDVDAGRVYDEFSEATHVIDPFPIKADWKAGIGVDLGYNHPSAWVWVAVDYNGNWYVYDEYVCRERTPVQQAPIIKEKGIFKLDGLQQVIYAPHDCINRSPITGTNWQQVFQDEGISLLKGNQEKAVVRIMKLKQQFRIRPDVFNPFTGKMGAPKLFIFKNCVNLIKSLGLYSWKDLKPGEESTKENPDEVIKVNDDECDALGYWAMGFTARQRPERPRGISHWEEELSHFTGADLARELFGEAA